MARLYADEQFPRIATEHLRSLGHENFVQLAERIHEAISSDDSLQNQLIRVMRPSQ
jgi:hypothetical protein